MEESERARAKAKEEEAAQQARSDEEAAMDWAQDFKEVLAAAGVQPTGKDSDAVNAAFKRLVDKGAIRPGKKPRQS
eukprot:10765872-Lingulodinium_polyedra.AAC.1